MTPRPIDTSWDRLERWLAARAPRTFASLPPAADQGAIDAAQALLGQRFPAELAESLLRHDGSGYFDVLGAFRLMSTREIVSARQFATRLEEETQLEGRAVHFILRDGYALWHPNDLPFASNAGGSHWVLDTKPHGATRKIARHDELGSTTFHPHEMWESLSHLLDSVATALETSTPLERRLPTTADGRLTWRITR
ncbi:SMI1/KNR4 family protein (plasmid) [Streptomyces canus]|uniref:SMI1/KNR4 family protein n=1 Tax=Streptomyces canus TaxID=58343 RepID=UPI002E2D332C|nr:SMI1/KNR4 family protein [Streptomyces canus]